MRYQNLLLKQPYGFKASLVEGSPHIGVLAPSLWRQPAKDTYHSVLKEMAEGGVRLVIIHVSEVVGPSKKLAFADMKPSTEDSIDVDLYLAGISDADIAAGAHSEHSAQSLRTISGVFGSLEEAVDTVQRQNKDQHIKNLF